MKETELLCAAPAHSWGQQQHCTLQSTKQINTLDTEEIQYHVYGAQEPRARMDAGTSQEVVFHEAAFHPEVRSQKTAEATVDNIYPFFNLFIMPTLSHSHTSFSACKVCSREEFVPKVWGSILDDENVAHWKLYFCSKISMHSPQVPEGEVCTGLAGT